MSTRLIVAVLAAGAVIVAAGCQRAAQQPQQQPAAEPMEGQAATVVAKEFAFEPKEIRVKAGMVKFMVKNEGTVEHEFMIEGVTMHGEHTTERFKPGVTHEVEVELKPGTYPVSCNVAGHKEAGMVATIVVE
ncbi:MAG TPA: cupredoxin domain-containing protein [bacterium]